MSDADDPRLTLAPTLRLRTLGGALLEGRDGIVTGASSQRRRLAMLALLAASGPGLSRDRLIGLLWPESTEERARHSLAQLLHALRRDLGDDAIAGSATTLRLNADVISSDVQEFALAVDSGDSARVAALYAGAFLDGFYLNGCADFERWVEERRATITHQAESAIESLAESAAAAGDARVSLDWWRRLAALRPFDSRVAIALVRANAAAGDPASALQHAHAHDVLLRDEFGTAPAAELGAEVDALRATAASSPAQTKPRASSPIASPPIASSPIDEAAQTPATLDANASGLVRPMAGASTRASSSLRSWRSRTALIGATIACVAAIAGLFAFAPRSAGDAVRDQPRQLIIADAENGTGEAVFDRTIPVALAAALAQSPRVQVLSPDRIARTLTRMRRSGADQTIDEKTAREIAQRDGVPIVTVPAITRAGTGYELTARVLDGPTGGVLAFSSARAERRADVLDALDRLGRQLRHQVGESARSIRANSTPLPLVTTRSLDALKKLADGERAFRGAQPAVAESLWTQAVHIDSTFAIAYADLGMVRSWGGRTAAGAAYYAHALNHLDSLPEGERVAIRASAKSWAGDHAGAATLLATYLATRPNDLSTLRAIGYEYFRMHQPGPALAAFTQLLAIDSMDYSVWVNVAGTHKQLGHLREAVAAYHRAFALEPEQLTANDNLNLEFGRTFGLAGQFDSAAAVFALLAARPEPEKRARALRSMAFLASFEGRYAEAGDDLAHAIALTPATSENGVTLARNHLLFAALLEERGHQREAAQQRDSADLALAHGESDPTMLYWIGKSCARAGDVARATRVLARIDANPNPSSPAYRAAHEALRGEVLIAQHRVAEGVAHLRAAATEDSTAIVFESLAYGNAVAGNVDDANAQYERIARGAEFGWEGQYASRIAPYLRGRVLERAGRIEAARTAYEQFVTGWPHPDADLRSMIDARERLARLQARGPGQ